MTIEPRRASTPTAIRLMAELDFLTELSQVVASNTEMQPILDWVVQKTTGMLGADAGSIKLSSHETESPTVQTLVRTEKKKGFQSGSWPRPISVSVMGFLMARDEPLATPNLTQDSRFAGLRGMDTAIRSVLAVPLKVGNHMTGMLAVTQQTEGRQWTQDEVQLLSIVAANSAGVIEQARLRVDSLEMQRLEEEQKRMERELEVASNIQKNMLPSRALREGPWEVLGQVVPARQVGGDAFDYFTLPQGRYGVAIGDVSGKGVPAALLMSNVQASLRDICDGQRPITAAIKHLNQNVARRWSDAGKFVTMFYGEMDSATGLLRYCNAGHNYPLVLRADGSLEELRVGGLPLGILEDSEYEQGEVSISNGEALLLYSDGITEALDARGEEFGEERLYQVWKACASLPSDQVIEALTKKVVDFRGPALQSDDMTIVALTSRSA